MIKIRTFAGSVGLALGVGLAATPHGVAFAAEDGRNVASLQVVSPTAVVVSDQGNLGPAGVTGLVARMADAPAGFQLWQDNFYAYETCTSRGRTLLTEMPISDYYCTPEPESNGRYWLYVLWDCTDLVTGRPGAGAGVTSRTLHG